MEMQAASEAFAAAELQKGCGNIGEFEQSIPPVFFFCGVLRG